MTPKAVIKQGKKDLVSSLADSMKSAASVVFVDYSGMGVKPQQELKKRLAEGGSTMVVAKNTLLQLAAKDAGISENAYSDTVLSGQTAMVVSDDAVSPIQTIGKFATEFEFPKMKAGVVEGSFQDAAGLMKISKLPNRETLYAQVVGAVSGPMYGIVGTLQGNLQKLVYLLNAKAQQG